MKESQTTKEIAEPFEFRPWHQGAVFLVAFAVTVSRRPDAIFHAQFYAEDGHFWFAEAYNLGWWSALFHTFGGYFQPLPRLVASFALLLPLSTVPLLFNLVAISFHVLPVNLLLSARSSPWGSLRFRALLAGMYLVLPNCREINLGLTNMQWPLALSAFILLVGLTPRSAAERVFDSLIILFCGLAGTFCILLLPVAFFIAWRYRDSWWRVPVAIFSICTIAQLWAMLFLAPNARAHRELGANPEMLGRLLGSQVYLGALLGYNGLSSVQGLRFSIFLACVAIGLTIFVAICDLRAPMAMKLFVVFSAAVFAAGLFNPFEWDRPTVPVWVVYAAVPGLRYWFFPTLAFAWALLYGYRSRIVPVKITSLALLCVMCVGVIRDWRHRPLEETNFSEPLKRFEAAPAGAVVTIEEQPEGWNMRLVKHLPGR